MYFDKVFAPYFGSLWWWQLTRLQLVKATNVAATRETTELYMMTNRAEEKLWYAVVFQAIVATERLIKWQVNRGIISTSTRQVYTDDKWGVLTTSTIAVCKILWKYDCVHWTKMTLKFAWQPVVTVLESDAIFSCFILHLSCRGWRCLYTYIMLFDFLLFHEGDRSSTQRKAAIAFHAGSIRGIEL